MFRPLINESRKIAFGGATTILVCILLSAILPRSVRGSDSSGRVIRGGGTTIIEGGTGSGGGFVPVITTVAFHATSVGDRVTGDFECLARAPLSATGAGSAEFTTNAMYVTGQITGAKVSGDTATLSGSATITGLGSGSEVPFTFLVRKGGPGATAVLTTGGDTPLVFHEVLVEGAFEVD
jgi:hypothetical protein